MNHSPIGWNCCKNTSWEANHKNTKNDIRKKERIEAQIKSLGKERLKEKGKNLQGIVKIKQFCVQKGKKNVRAHG